MEIWIAFGALVVLIVSVIEEASCTDGLDQPVEKESDLESDNITKRFVQLRDWIFKLIGDSESLLALRSTIDQIVTLELPRYLKRRRELLDDLVVARENTHMIGEEFGPRRAAESRRRLEELEETSRKIDYVLRSLKVRLSWTLTDVASFKAGHSDGPDNIRRDHRRLNAYLEKIQNSVRKPRLFQALIDEASSEYAYQAVDESSESEFASADTQHGKVH